MPTPRRRTLVLKSAFAFDASKWRPLSGLRSSVGLGIPIVWAALTGHTALGMLAANGALNAALPSMNSVVARRMQVMLSVSVTTALIAVLGVLVGQSLLGTVLAITVVATALTLYGAGGPINTSVGIACTNTLIVLSGLQLAPSSAPLSGVLVLAGGLLQTFLLAVVWPVNPRGRERESVAEVYHTLGRLLSHLPESVSTVPESEALQEAWAALGEAQGHGWHAEHAAMRQALRVAEGIRAALVGYARADDTLRHLGGAEERGAKEAAVVLVGVLRQVEASVRRGQPTLAPESARALEVLLDHLNTPEFQELAYWLRLMTRLLDDLDHPPVMPPAVAAEIPPGVWASLQKLPRPSLDSPATRHAIKYGLVLGLATLGVRLLNLPHGYWLVLTAAVVLRQDYVTTLTRGIGRLGGTFAGVLITALLTWLLHPTPSVMAALSLGGAFLTFALFPTGYAAFSAALTIYVVFAIAAAGFSEGLAVELRLALTLAGGLLALVAYLFFPTWQAVGTRKVLHAAAKAQRHYLATLGRLWQQVDGPNIEAASVARQQARVARLQAESVVQASQIEPSRSHLRVQGSLAPAAAQAYLQRLNANAALSLSLHARAAQEGAGQPSDFLRAEREADALVQELEG